MQMPDLKNKKVLIPVAIGAVAFVGWKYWQSRGDAGAGADSTISDGEFGAVDSSIPGVVGAVSPTNSYGSGDSGSDDEGNDPTRFTSNSQWSTYVRTQLQGSYDDAAIVGALGNYLGSQPLSSEQQTIVRGAIAVGGYPPVGSFSLISGGNTNITIAPGNARLESVTETSARIAFNPVAGASRYLIYRSDISPNVGQSTVSPITISGLTPGKSYTVTVTATNAAGASGPRSNSVTFKTKAYALGKPATPSVSGITKTSVVAKTSTVAHAVEYKWYVNNIAHGSSTAPSYTINGLSSKKQYTITVSASIPSQGTGPRSAGKQFTTK